MSRQPFARSCSTTNDPRKPAPPVTTTRVSFQNAVIVLMVGGWKLEAGFHLLHPLRPLTSNAPLPFLSPYRVHQSVQLAIDMFCSSANFDACSFIEEFPYAKHFIQRNRFIERALGNAQILQEFLPVLPPFSFSDILRDGCRSPLHLRNQTKVSALRYMFEQSQDIISKLDRLLPHFQLLEWKDIPISRFSLSFSSNLLPSYLQLLTSPLNLILYLTSCLQPSSLQPLTVLLNLN